MITVDANESSAAVLAEQKFCHDFSPSATMTWTTCSCSNERSIKYSKRSSSCVTTSAALRDDIRGENGGQLAFDDRAYRASTGALTRRQTRVFVGS